MLTLKRWQTLNGRTHQITVVSKVRIKHVIVIIGDREAQIWLYSPRTRLKQPGERVDNLLSKRTVALDASKQTRYPGPNFNKASQLAAQDTGTSDAFLLSPPKQQFPNNQLPAPLVGGPKEMHRQ